MSERRPHAQSFINLLVNFFNKWQTFRSDVGGKGFSSTRYSRDFDIHITRKMLLSVIKISLREVMLQEKKEILTLFMDFQNNSIKS